MSILKLKAIHDATQPGARLKRRAASPATSAPDTAKREDLLSALAADADDEGD